MERASRSKEGVIARVLCQLLERRGNRCDVLTERRRFLRHFCVSFENFSAQKKVVRMRSLAVARPFAL